MRKIYFLFSLNAVSAVIIAQSPITLGNSNMPTSGDTLRYTSIQLSSVGNYTQTGINSNWNFSNVVATGEGLRSFKSAFQTPYSILFGLTGYGEKIADTLGAGPLTLTNYYNFYKKQSSPVNAFIADGVGMTYSSIPIPCYYSDKDELYNFPMSYPKYDSTTFKFTTTTGGIIPISYSKAGYRVTKVDGWGTITTPYGTASCLRLITTQYAMDSIKNTIVPFPLGFPNYQRSYQWLTLSSKIPFMEVSGTLIGNNFLPTVARYRGYDKTEKNLTALNEDQITKEIRFFPNPVKDLLWLEGFKALNTALFIYNNDGKFIGETSLQHFGERYFIDVSTLPKGVYLLKTVTEQEFKSVKFIKE
jgi:hypothetical protein